jgi:cytoskeletal protein CcmA (bactofilin family)
VGSDDRIAGAVRTINGSITLDASADVAGRVASVNGALRLTAAHVGGGLETTNGDIDVGAQSRVEGGMLVGTASDGWLDWLLHGWFHLGDRPRIVIGPGAVVRGTLKFEREVTLYVSDRATIDAIRGATAIRYSGAQPGT